MVMKGEGGRDKRRVGDQHIHSSIYKIDNQQGPTVQHRELYSIFCNNYMGKESEKEWMYAYQGFPDSTMVKNPQKNKYSI